MYGHRVLESFVWANIERMVRLGVGVLQVAWMARYLGPASFGLLGSAAALIGLSAGVTTLGLDSILVRRIALHPEDCGHIIGTALGLRLASGVLVLAAFLAGIWGGLVPVDERLVTSVIALTSVTQALTVFESWFKGHTLQKPVAWAQIVAFLTAFGLRLAGIRLGAGLWFFAFVAVLEVGLSGGLLAAGWWYRSEHRLARPERDLAWSLLAESWPQIVAGVAVAACMRADLVLVARLLGDAATGEYAAAVRISELIHFVPVALVSALAPTILRLRDREPQGYARVLASLLALSLWGGLLVAGGLWLGAGQGVTLLFGSRYQGATSILRIHCWTNATVFLGSAWSVYWLAERRQGVSMLITVAGALAAIVGTFVLVPHLGTRGAAVAALGGQLVPFAVLLLWRGPRRLLVAVARAFFRPVMAVRSVLTHAHPAGAGGGGA